MLFWCLLALHARSLKSAWVFSKGTWLFSMTEHASVFILTMPGSTCSPRKENISRIHPPYQGSLVGAHKTSIILGRTLLGPGLDVAATASKSTRKGLDAHIRGMTAVLDILVWSDEVLPTTDSLWLQEGLNCKMFLSQSRPQLHCTVFLHMYIVIYIWNIYWRRSLSSNISYNKTCNNTCKIQYFWSEVFVISDISNTKKVIW